MSERCHACGGERYPEPPLSRKELGCFVFFVALFCALVVWQLLTIQKVAS